MGDASMSVEQGVTVEQQEKQPALEFDEKLERTFANNPRDGTMAREIIPGYINSPNRFDHAWWTDLFTLLDTHDYHGLPSSIARTILESLDTLPPHIRLPRFMNWYIAYINAMPEKEPERKQIFEALKNPSVPPSLKIQLGRHVAESDVYVYSVNTTMQAYRILGEDIGEEVREQIFPLFVAGLAYGQYEPYQEDLVKLFEEAVVKDTNPRKPSLLSRIRANFKSKPHPEPYLWNVASIDKNDKKSLAERRVGVIRDIVLELSPPTPGDQNLDDKFMRLGFSINSYPNPCKAVSLDMSTLPVETLEKYLAELRQLKELPEFTNLPSSFLSDKGIVQPYVALGRASSHWDDKKRIPLTSILHHLSELDKSGSLDNLILNDFLLGMGVDISHDEVKTSARRNLRILMEHQLPQETNDINIAYLLTIPEENVFKNVLDIAVSMALENKKNGKAIYHLTSKDVINQLRDLSSKREDISVFLEAYKALPALTGLHEQFAKQFNGRETVQFFKDISAAYGYFPDRIVSIVNCVGSSRLSRERALELPTKANDILVSQSLFSLAMQFPNLFLVTDKDTEFFRNMLASYKDSEKNIPEVAALLENNRMTREMTLAFPQQAPGLMQDKMKETRTFIWNHGETMLKDTSDLKFLNRLVGEFGQKADPLIRGYQECLEAGVITTDEKELVLEFAKQFRVIAPATLTGYKEAKQAGQEKAYIAQLKTLAERMTGSGTITKDDRKKPYYNDLLRHVYANNSCQWSSFENNDSCADRSGDLADLKIKPRYEIDLLSNSEIRIKVGETLNHSVQDEVQQPILEVAERMNALGHNKEKIMSMLQKNTDDVLEEIVQKGGLQGIDLKTLTSTEEKMFLVLTDSIYGTRSIDPKRVKDLVITYEFAAFEDISDYIAGTSDRVGRASNQDYALLCEVGAFYSDRIKEINRRLVTAAYNNPQITALMPKYFSQLARDSAATQRQDRINRLRVDRLGISESFVKQLTGVLEKRKGRKYSPSEVEEVIRRYEGLTGGLQEKTSASKNPQTRTFYGQLRSQRERTFEALQVIAGEKADPKTVHLGEISLQQALETETGIKEGKYNGEQFASYTVQRFIDLFDNERVKIETELAKFESMSGTQREVLHGYITKSKESANARMVGGVCVAGDNPSKNKDQNMWNMPNYFQLVFQEPDTLQCQGLVLLHHFTQDGKRILTASINPSSTYLYSVDEAALFNGIMETLGQFAQDNDFDMITVSQNRTIRTNRTGGQFEKTMDARVTSVGKKFKFNSPQAFSYNPNYQLQEMDVVWERNLKI